MQRVRQSLLLPHPLISSPAAVREAESPVQLSQTPQRHQEYLSLSLCLYLCLPRRHLKGQQPTQVTRPRLQCRARPFPLSYLSLVACPCRLPCPWSDPESMELRQRQWLTKTPKTGEERQVQQGIQMPCWPQ